MSDAQGHSRKHGERHFVTRSGWLRAAVLGANDGVLSTGSLMAGVAAASFSDGPLVLTGVAGVVAGALSMAAGEYVSVGSQADSEEADLQREHRELHEDPHAELAELTLIYEGRGLDRALARQVAEALMRNNALDAHARDELGITGHNSANPLQAAVASAASFVVGGAAPVLAAVFVSGRLVLPAITGVSLSMLALLGAAGAKVGGAPLLRGALRVFLLGAGAMILSALAGHLFSISI